MKNDTKVKILIGGVLFVLVIVLGSILDSTLELRIERAQIESFKKGLIDQFQLGAPQSQVVEYLQSKNYDISTEKNGSQIEAVDHSVSRSPFITEDYHMIFNFDKTHHLANIQVEPIATKP